MLRILPGCNTAHSVNVINCAAVCVMPGSNACQKFVRRVATSDNCDKHRSQDRVILLEHIEPSVHFPMPYQANTHEDTHLRTHTHTHVCARVCMRVSMTLYRTAFILHCYSLVARF